MIYTKIVAIFILIISIFICGYYFGCSHKQNEFDSYINEQEEKAHDLLIARVKFIEALLNRHKAENDLIKDEYEKEISNLRNIFTNSERLRVPKAACRGLSATAEAASPARGDEGTTETRLLSRETSDSFRQYALDADEIVSSCRTLQKFVTANGMVP